MLLVAVFLLGGGARGDIASLMILRPLAIMLLALGLITLRREHVDGHRFLFAMAIAIILFLIVQVVPLPFAIWQRFPGRELVTGIDAATGLTGTWRPISLDPEATWNALFAALVPASALVLGAQLHVAEHRRLLPILLVIGAVSALIGLCQMLSDPWGWLYFYHITNNGSPVGLFANRNHQALFLAMMLPILAATFSRDGRRSSLSLVAVAAGLVLLPVILIAGSRAGVIAAAFALCSIPLLVSREAKPRGNGQAAQHASHRGVSRFAVLTSVVGIALIALTLMLGRDRAWERLSGTRVEDELRWTVMPTVMDMIGAYFPFGTGTGSFERVFRVHEPDALLGPGYMQQAHNDWLDVLLTGGAVGAVLLGVAVIAFVVCIGRRIARAPADKGGATLSVLGLVLVALMGLSSLVDYPLRVPSLACLFVLAALWASGPGPSANHSASTRGREASRHSADDLRGTS